MPLLDDLLKKPVGPPIQAPTQDPMLTSKVDVRENRAEVVVNLTQRDVEAGVDPDSLAAQRLLGAGEDPEMWEITNFRSSEWTMPGGEVGQSARFSFRKRGIPEQDLNDLLSSIDSRDLQIQPHLDAMTGDHGFIVALGDMQFGKIDGDGAEGTLKRTLDYIDLAAERLEDYRDRFDIEHVHLAWLGDHIEGFTSQGGANAWRTGLTLNEQIRLTRRVMLYALQTFAPLCSRLTMAAVPGNHGEPQRFAGKGLTRYDDSHDTEALIAVKDAVDLADRDDYRHVEFFVPETDELTVVVNVAGTVIGHAHGHQFTSGRHFDWWKGQAFNAQSALGQCDVLLCGHLHHTLIEEDGKRLFLQVPALESESTWWRHRKGPTGNPGLIVAVTKDGTTSPLEVVR